MKRYIMVLCIGLLFMFLAVGCNNANMGNENEGDHEHVFSQWETVKPASCEENGTSQRKCLKCDYSETDTIPALGHDPESEKITKAATCTEPGSKETGKCKRCGKGGETETISALGHDPEGEKIIKPATCTEPGSKETGKCKRCGKGGETETIPALGHDLEGEKITKAATCTEPGSKETGKCKRCGKGGETETIPATGHSWGNFTDNNDGTMSRYCTKCGDKGDTINVAEGETIEYTINIVNEDDCDFQVTDKMEILLFKDISPCNVLKGAQQVKIRLEPAKYLVRADNLGDAYMQTNVCYITIENPVGEIRIGNNPDYDPAITGFVNENDTMFDFIVKDTRKTESEYKKLSELIKDKKLVYIDFFYIACSPCEYLLDEHLKYYATLEQNVKDKVLVIMIDTTNEEARYINEFRTKKNIPEEFITVAKGGKIFKHVKNNGGTPHGLFLDENLKAVSISSGANFKEMVNKYVLGKDE